MRCNLLILSLFFLITLSGHDAHAVEFGTRHSFQHLQDLSAKGPRGEALSLGYETVTHSFLLPYKMTGDYVILVKDSGRDALAGRDVYHALSQEKIEQMQRAGALPSPLPPYRHTIVDYLFAYILWWCFPAVLIFIWLFSALGIGSKAGDEARS